MKRDDNVYIVYIIITTIIIIILLFICTFLCLVQDSVQEEREQVINWQLDIDLSIKLWRILAVQIWRAT